MLVQSVYCMVVKDKVNQYKLPVGGGYVRLSPSRPVLFCIGFMCMMSIAIDSAPASNHPSRPVQRQTQNVSQADLQTLYQKAATLHHIPWTLLAAVDRYAELTKSKSAKKSSPAYGLAFDPYAWAGLGNPNFNDINPETISLFGGLGKDGDGDGFALPTDQADRVITLAAWMDDESPEEDYETAVWTLTQDPIAMDRIFAFNRLFEAYGLSAVAHSFPIAMRYNYTVKHTFGAGRSFGGRRIHEGVDIFAGYGTPVLACSYGYVELIGWNRFGGWRVGIRDANNMYYYYAHLSSYVKGLRQGELVRPGQVIGYVGSTGYGPPGTSGKFPPHLHFGMYKDTGRHEWAISPSSYLQQWQRQKQTIIYPQKTSQLP